MYCWNCGAQVREGAKFCAECGAAVSEGGGVGGGAGQGASVGAGQGAGAGSNAGPERERRQNPLLQRVVVGGTSVPVYAFALVCVLVTCVVVLGAVSLLGGNAPSPGDSLVSTDGGQGAEADDPDGSEGGDSGSGTSLGLDEVEIVEATGDYENLLQLADQLALDPDDLYYIASHIGGSPLESALGSGSLGGDSSWNPATSSDFAAWQIYDDGDFGNCLRDTELDVDDSSGSIGSLYLGLGLTPAAHLGEPYNQVSRFRYFYSSEQPDSILLYLQLEEPLNERGIKILREACRFTSKAQRFDYELEDSYGTQTHTVLAGLIDVNGETKVWYIDLSASTGEYSYTSLALGVTTLNAARELVDITELFDSGAWGKAENSKRMLMFAQSLVQDLTTGNGGFRTNVLTGKSETLDADWHWQPE